MLKSSEGTGRWVSTFSWDPDRAVAARRTNPSDLAAPADNRHRRQRGIANRPALGTSVLAALDTTGRLGCLSTSSYCHAAAIALAVPDTIRLVRP